MKNYDVILYLNGHETTKKEFCEELGKTVICKNSNKTIYDYLDFKISEMLRSGCLKVAWYLKDNFLEIKLKEVKEA